MPGARAVHTKYDGRLLQSQVERQAELFKGSIDDGEQGEEQSEEEEEEEGEARRPGSRKKSGKEHEVADFVQEERELHYRDDLQFLHRIATR